MFRVLRLDQHPAAVVEGHEAVVPPRPGEMIWIDIQEFTEAELNLLAERFKFHPLAIEDCLQPDMRAKLDEYDEYIFIVAHTLACKEGALPPAGLRVNWAIRSLRSGAALRPAARGASAIACAR